jgi:hypothetical protein
VTVAALHPYPDATFLAEVREARENGYAVCCVACGVGLAQNGFDMHVPGCPHAADEHRAA